MRNLSQSDPSSPIYRLLNDKSAAAGHSEGGAASFISGTRNTDTKLIANVDTFDPHRATEYISQLFYQLRNFHVQSLFLISFKELQQC